MCWMMMWGHLRAARSQSILAIAPHVLDHDNSITLQWSQTYFYLPIPQQPRRPSAQPPTDFVDFRILNETLFRIFAAALPLCNWSCVDLVLIVTSSTFSPKTVQPYALAIPPPILLSTLHHREHAAYAFYTSPFARAVVLTIDGQGTYQASFVLWSASREHGLRRLPCDMALRLGALYGCSQRPPNDMAIAAATHAPDQPYYKALAGLLARRWNQNSQAMIQWHKWFQRHPADSSGKLAALYTIIEETIVAHLRRSHADWGGVDGIALGGGVAANIGHGVGLSRHFRLPVWRPAQPNDATLGFGAIWTNAPPAERPAVQFAGPPLPPDPGPAAAAACEAFSAARLRALLSLGAVVGVWQGRAPLEDAGTPGHRTAVGCAPGPRPPPVPKVLVPAPAVQDIFVAPAALASPSHAFLLQARPHIARRLNISWAQVAPVEARADAVVDVLLEGARGCPAAPLLFCAPLQPHDVASGPHDYLWSGDALCKRRG